MAVFRRMIWVAWAASGCCVGDVAGPVSCAENAPSRWLAAGAEWRIAATDSGATGTTGRTGETGAEPDPVRLVVVRVLTLLQGLSFPPGAPVTIGHGGFLVGVDTEAGVFGDELVSTVEVADGAEELALEVRAVCAGGPEILFEVTTPLGWFELAPSVVPVPQGG